MLGNIILGFMIPVLIGGWILRRHPKILIIFYPLGVAASACVNSVGFNFFWNILPNSNNQSYTALPMDLGIYPISGCLMMFAILNKGTKPWLAIVITAVVLTLIEWLAKEMGRVVYFNGWNIYWTALSYLLPLVLAYGYGLLFRKQFIQSEQ
ncbi:hypothetical protein [Paenibacillus sp. ACRRY]|uniref:hypothetical protein n=1 Tax=Paenibacillus sp. ACRRY TaxID=2918208 RepID=UPI001EF666BB|nr:hypothetical protein [Paenibacillus sp. ACRRY]MCG7381319.1 hypothetical protein [Paenibacillus sp. ACRRY]